MAAMEELEAHLQSLQTLKIPGVTPTKVKAITQLCVDNVQSNTVIVQKILQQLQNSAATHKLGVLYVVDSVARQWVEKAKAAGQAVSKNAAPGTFASGVQLIRDVLPTAMNYVLQSAPENQKEKISKLLDIWERGHTFPPTMLADFKQLLTKGQLNSSSHAQPSPSKVQATGQAVHAQTNPLPTAPVAYPPTTQGPNALFAALASLNQSGVPTNSAPVVPPAFALLQNMVPPPPPGFLPPSVAAIPQPQAPPSTAGNGLTTQILQAMNAGSITPDQALQVITALAAQSGIPMPVPQAQPFPQVQAQPQTGVQNGGQPHRYEQNDTRMRDRSRSPDYVDRSNPNRRSPQNTTRRDSPTYGAYNPTAGPEGNGQRPDRGERGRGRGKQRNRNERNEYRQRSPVRRQASPARNGSGQSKYIEWDDSLHSDHIRVLSRTLFIGGAGGTEGEIRSIFSRFGQVQTCIVNQDKRHAFVKMFTRPDAVAAKEGMDNIQDSATQSKARQTRWGVGFGPRDCSDYQTGISVIPISRLTKADREWALNAEHGGTGGRPLEGGMVIEEPDIEIGAGVSSKAISRRVTTDAPRGGRGGFGGRGGGFDNGATKFRKQDRPANDPRHISPRPDQGVAVPPAVPGFGFQLPGFS